MADPIGIQASHWSLEDIEANAERALEYFPSIKVPKEALKEYAKKYKIQGIFWTEEDGQRYAWGPDVENFVTKFWRKNTSFTYVGDMGRKYEILERPLTLDFINQPSSRGFRVFTAHTSEKGRGWNLPVNNVHHFLNFPTEILIRILELLLVAPKAATIRPMTVTSNWKRTYTTPSFQLLDKVRARLYGRQYGRALEESFAFADTSRLIAWTPKADANGPYTLKREIIIPILDATVLRTCKLLYGYGSQILYGYNNFDFHTFDGHNEMACPPRSLIMGKDYRPSPKKPRGDEWEGKINEGITQISLRRPITMLEGYVYHDPFLRFLHTVGPKNASLIQNLIFMGKMKLHFCLGDNCSQKCADDLATSIQVYTPFIQRFCKGLHTLALFPLRDEFWGLDTAPQGEPQNFKEAVSRLIRNPISKTRIENLLVFEYVPEHQIRDLEDTDDEDSWEADRIDSEKRAKNVLLKFAMAEWAKARKESQETQEEEGTAHPEAITRPYTTEVGQILHPKTRDPKCDFCGEKHVWPDCYNLCKVCGEYGHWGSLCPRVQKRWYE